MNFSTIVDLLQYRSLHENQKNQNIYTFLQDGETEAGSLSYQELEKKARAIAAYLQSLNAYGNRVVLLYSPGLEFIAGFFGCLYAGAIAVPAYPPRPDQTLDRLDAIVSDAEAKFAFTTTSLVNYLQSRFAENPKLMALNLIATDNITNTNEVDWRQPKINTDTLAFLQYTSGSTGAPKGVMISHGNMMHNLAMNAAASEFHANSRTITWLPFGHNTGMLTGVVQPLYNNFPVIIMSPLDFLQKPLRWLTAISQYKGTQSLAPNFAYDLVCFRTTSEERATLDLSCWELAASGAEPVRAETIERFVNTFSPYGFRREAFIVGYGMAESVVTISVDDKHKPVVILDVEKAAFEQNRIVVATNINETTQKIVSCGRTLLDQKIIIVNPESLTQSQTGEVGEVWVSSPSVAQGYWNNEKATQEITGYLADTHEGPFLRTGDLGFLHDGELFVTGRRKDLIIIRGRNHYPQDIEFTVQNSHPALQPSCNAAFSIELESEERLVIAQEVKQTHLDNLDIDEVITAVRQAISKHHDLQVYAVVLLKSGTIPKTSSNKIQRRACRVGFLNESLNLVGQWQQSKSEIQPYWAPDNFENGLQLPQTAEAIQAWLVQKISQQTNLHPENIDVRASLASYALDSVQAVNISGELENLLERKLSPSLLWDYPTIEQLTQYIIGGNETSNSKSVIDWDAESILDTAISAGNLEYNHVSNPKTIFLTGATGFLGAFLVDELLKQTQANIYCLVRSNNLESGKQRVKNNLQAYGLWQEDYNNRIIPVLGDVSQPLLGLSAEQFQAVAGKIDVIYHSAALLNYVYPYERFKSVNVLGTQEILRLASLSKLKPVHHISSVAVFESSAYKQKLVTESDQLNYTEGMYLGYSQSKWVAEKLVMSAHARGIPVCIYRPPFISGHAQTGVWNTDDIICRVIKGCIQMESIAETEQLLDLSPVDYVSRAIVYLSQQKQSLGKAFHLNNPHKFYWKQISDLLKSFGYNIEKIPLHDWQSKLEKSTQDNPLYPLLPFYLKKWSEEQLTITELYYESRRPTISCQDTVTALAQTDIQCPPIDTQLLKTYFSYFIHSGFLKVP